MKKAPGGYRQGDVLLQRVPKGTIPADARARVRDERGRLVLEYGEATGHAHAILEREAEYLETGTAKAAEEWLRTRAAVPMVHEEHAPAALPEGEYARWKAYEYSPAELRQVRD